MLNFTERFHATITGFTHDGARSLRTLLQRGQAYLVCIGKTGFLTADGTHADALVDVVRAIFDDAVFQNPGFVIARLEIEIAIVETAFGQLTKNGEQVLMAQAVRCEQMFTYQVQTHLLLLVRCRLWR